MFDSGPPHSTPCVQFSKCERLTICMRYSQVNLCQNTKLTGCTVLVVEDAHGHITPMAVFTHGCFPAGA